MLQAMGLGPGQIPPSHAIRRFALDVRGKSFVVVEAIHLGEPEEADALRAPLRALDPVDDTIETIPVQALSRLHMDPEQPGAGATGSCSTSCRPSRWTSS
jgi:hypothetical protein